MTPGITIVASALLHEKVTWMTVIGVALILAGKNLSERQRTWEITRFAFEAFSTKVYNRYTSKSLLDPNFADKYQT